MDTAVSGSIAKQRARLARHAADDVVWYVDESVSGSKVPFASRPQSGRLLADLARGDRVLVTRIDRAARNVRDLLGLVELIEQRGASIVFVDQNIDTAGPMGRFLLTLLGAIAELEAGIIAERRKESLAAFREEGRHAVGRAPYGLRSVQNPNGRGLVLRPDPDEAPIVRAAAADILAGGAQAHWVERTGLSPSSLSRILRNERLAGILSAGPDGVRLDPDMAIFSLPEWRRLQDFLRRPDIPRRKETPGYGPALVCAVCGERLYYQKRSSSETYDWYRCRRVKHAPGQGAGSVPVARANAHIESEFLRRFGRFPVYEEITTDSSSVRDEAVALARLELDAARDAQDAATTEDEEERSYRAYRRAKQALRAAEELPTETVTAQVPTGETFAQVWEQSDDAARSSLLLQAGPWVVEPGRGLPIDQKVHFAGNEPDYLAGQLDN